MGFWKLFKKNKLPHKSPDTIIAELTIGYSQYILKEFNVSFKQKIDNDGKPEGDVYFNHIQLVMDTKPDSRLFDWSTSGSVQQYGEVIFYSCNEKITKGSLLKISFQKARCVNMDRNTSTNEEHMTTKLLIEPNSITIGNETIEKRTDI